MADIVSKLKTAALVAGTALFVVACGEKAADTNVDVTTTEEAPAAVEAPVADAATMEAAPVDPMAPTDGTMEAAPADTTAAPAPDAAPAQ
ncbi:hypothetical protein GCM10007973_02670 [Polymorphobacter multimanifer]|uniref:PBP1b-binding outer membrane lipoprotein LpoB n=1 Tax=Polymorphobacter multimanifer TaxID=1070431 RepID=A0A841L2H0_9SPHN|nr:hypothetical protein [Polymorphobacter multimanifer]MBB6226630.1 PBP1b-binding outer membrane lipoprotein LpoB [Polymorphobacter multimanifer]GGI69042.1 hypothetical protein GCM10007973_02670 [Polymorphobacter multimanifer]